MGLVSFFAGRDGGVASARSAGRPRPGLGARALSLAAARAVEPLEGRTLFATYTVVDLGSLGGPTSDAAAINNNGQIAVTATQAPGASNLPASRAARYANGTLTDLGTFGGDDSVAAGINGGGNVVGYAADGNAAFRAFLFDGTNKTNLGTLGGAFSVATAVNDDNAVVGSSQDVNEMGPEHAFVWRNGTMTDLGTLTSVGSDFSKAYAINNDGLIVGESRNIAGEARAFRRPGTSLVDMGVLSGDQFSAAYGVNDAGQIVGTSGKDVNNVTTKRAFLFNGSSMASLGTLSGDNVAQANDINNNGVVVGYSANDVDLNDQRAVVHTAGSMQDLNGLIDGGTGWTLVEAKGVNDAGQIVGVGLLNNQLRGFLLNPSGISPPPPVGGAPTATITPPAPANGSATVTVTVTYTDDQAVSAASIGTNDIVVARSGGGNLTVTGVTTNATGDAGTIVASYTVAAPGGSWDAADDGDYTVALQSGAVTDAGGAAAAATSVPFTVNFTADSGPTATIGAPGTVTTAGGTTGTVTVTYTDPSNVSVASIDVGDITVSGGGSAALPITGVSVSPNADGSPVTVTYTFTPPGGTWDAADNDTYTVSLQPNQVLDTTGRAATGGSVQFAVDIPVIRPTVDPAFGGGNAVGAGFVAEATVADLDGKLYVVGHSGDLTAGTSVGQIRRYNPDGSLDSTFDRDGLVTTPAGSNEAFYNVALDPAGKSVVVSGARGGDFLVARYTTRGRIDSRFGTRGAAVVDLGGATEAAYGLAVAPDSSVYAGGGTGSGLAFLKFTSRGRADESFGLGGSVTVSTPEGSTVSALAVQADGFVVAAADVEDAVTLTRIASDGALDPNFNGGTAKTIDELAVRTALVPADRTIGLALQPDGKILVANRTPAGTFGVVRLDAAGANDASFSGDGLATVDFGGDDDADQVLVQGTGEIVLVGTTDAGGSPQTAVAVLDAAGNPASAFDADGKFAVASGVTDPATSLVVGGQPVKANGTLSHGGQLVTVTSSGSPTSGGAVRRLNVLGANQLGQFGIVNGRRKSLAFVDADGSRVTLSLKVGTGTVLYDGTDVDVVLTGTTVRSSVGASIKGGDGRTRFGSLRTDGALGGFSAKTGDVAGTFFVNGELRKFEAGTLTGLLAANGNIGSVSLRGDFAGGDVLAGANLGGNALLGGGDDAFAPAVISKFSVGGGMAASAVGAGFDPVDGNLLNGGTVAGGPASVIRSISVKRTVDTASRFFAGAFGKIKVPGGRVDVATDERFEVL